MKKTTFMLAAMGIVAGLGVASLPLGASAVKSGFKYVDGGDAANNITAATNDDPITTYDENADGVVTGDILVATRIDKTLSMYIQGNADEVTAAAGTPFETVKPSDKAWVLLSETAADLDGKILNGGTGTGTADVTIITNNTTGYNVKLKASGDASLVGEADNAHKIPAADNDVLVTNASDKTTSGWGYKVTHSITSADATITAPNAYVAPTTGDVAVFSKTAVTGKNASTPADGDTFTIDFMVKASNVQAADIYTNTVTLTASAPAA